ncbi:site-specific DNA-methyltransferase [Spirabiliibacterium pneumoniae]|uniref:site-specific DNA-methyltransferase n=1 Tax=Spirabiliibacterium pneumoniae TaxID=221400 RepID=UPI0038B583D0
MHGDNLDAVKSLLPFYAGQVKCIFIDPPYNTKKAFEHYDDNLEHSLWLSLMYPRLELLRELLAEDGSIWITIDDKEGHYFKVMCDEIFGRDNFVANVVWQHSIQGKNDSKLFSLHHNQLLVFRKSERFQRNLLLRLDEHNVNYKNPDNDPNGAWRSGDFRSPNLRENLRYEVTTPSGKIIHPPEKGWRWSKKTFMEKVASGEIVFIEDETKIIRKIYLFAQKGRIPETIWFGKDVGTTRDAKDEVKAFNSDEVFDTPKPEKLLQRILHLATNEGDLVLDSFLGSGTTAAVAHKMNRRYIGIEIGNHAKTHVIPRLKKVIEGEQGGISVSQEFYELENDELKSLDLDIEDLKKFNKVLKSIGQTDLLDKATLKKIQTAAKLKKIRSESVWHGGGSFRFCELGEMIFDEFGAINSAIQFDDLAAHIWYAENYFPLPALQNNAEKSPLIGVHNGKAFYLLFNGILGDKRPQGGNVLTSLILKELPRLDEFVQAGLDIVVYGESCRLASKKLAKYNMTFKLIPHDVSAK